MDLLGIGTLAFNLIDKFIPDPEAKAKALFDLEQMKQNGELAKMANDTELFKTEVQDRDSARKRETEIATAEKAPLINKVVTPILALGVVAMTFVLFGVVVFNSDAIEQGKKELVMYILGSLTMIVGQVLQYYFGSSSNSAKKDATIASMTK